jgi:hypothetical protein
VLPFVRERLGQRSDDVGDETIRYCDRVAGVVDEVLRH